MYIVPKESIWNMHSKYIQIDQNPSSSTVLLEIRGGRIEPTPPPHSPSTRFRRRCGSRFFPAIDRSCEGGPIRFTAGVLDVQPGRLVKAPHRVVKQDVGVLCAQPPQRGSPPFPACDSRPDLGRCEICRDHLVYDSRSTSRGNRRPPSSRLGGDSRAGKKHPEGRLFRRTGVHVAAQRRAVQPR
jgi:hypothetical protein